jgi:hypothetical protein
MELNLQSFRRIALVIGLTLAISLLTTPLWSQATSGDVVGTVVDASGAVVPNATVNALNVATGIKSTTKTNASGEYRFSNLPVGRYNVSSTSEGYGVTTVQAAVELNKTSTVQLKLQVGKVSTTVEVGAVAPAIDTTTAQLQSTYEPQQLQDLPTASVGLGVLNLSLLQAGVASAGSMGAGTGPSVGGQRPRNNNFTIEGVDNNDKGVTGPLVYIPNDAVAEFSVLQNQFSPEFGHSTGGQFNTVVISGTNNFHGKVYEYMQNRNMNAVDYSLANQGITSNPRYDNNRFGGQIGGPILKNKLFFFFNYEYNPIGQAASPGSPLLAPTASGYATLGAIPGVSAANINLLKTYAQASNACTASDISAKICPAGGTVSVAGTPVQLGVLPVVAPNFVNNYAYIGSVDYNISDKDKIRGRYIRNNYSSVDTAATLPVFFTPLVQPYYMASISEYHTFSSNVTNELRLGYLRTGYNYTVGSQTAPGLDMFPNITINNLGGINVGPDPNAPQYSVQNTYQLTNNLSVIKGNHSLKFGVEGRKYISPQLFIQRSRGDYAYTTLEGYALDQVPDGIAERSMGTAGYSGDQAAFYWYVNDVWKIRRNLSLNLGLRYEYTTTPYGWTQQALNSVADTPGLITFGSPQAPKKNFMPRLGFAWSPGGNSNTSVRGGFGMGYDVLYDNIGTLERPPQIGSTVDCPGNPVCPTSAFLANGGIKPVASSGISVLSRADAIASTSSFLPNNVKYPYSMQWNLGVQHVFANNYTIDVRYVGTRGVDLNTQTRLNMISVVTPTVNLPTYLTAPSQATLNALPYTLSALKAMSNYGSSWTAGGFDQQPITAYMPWGASSYHGLQTQLNRRFSNGLQFQAAWTWSHTIDNSTADFFSTVLTPRRPQDFQNMQAEKSNSALDRRHRITLQAIYDVPWFKNSGSFLKNVLGNFEVTPTYTFETGEQGDVQSAIDSNLNGDSAGDRAVFNPFGTPGVGSGVTPLCTSGLAAAITAGTLPAGTTCGATKVGTVSVNTTPYIVGYLANNPNAQYIIAGSGALATSSRNTLQMKPINNWDLSIVKRLTFTERYKFELGGQFMNLFNHPQFIGGYINTVNPITNALGTSTAVKNYLTPNASNFNAPQATFPSNARTMQVFMKFSF